MPFKNYIIEVIMKYAKLIMIPMMIICGTISANSGLAVDVNLYSGADGADTGTAEIVWAINRGELGFVKTDAVWTDTLDFSIEVKAGGETVLADTIRRIVDIPRGEMISESFLLFDNYIAELPINRAYVLNFGLHDLGSDEVFEISETFWMPSFEGPMALSGLALLGEVEETSEPGLFVRNGYRMLPNPSGVFGVNFPALYYYLEVYRDEGISGNIRSRWIIHDAEELVVAESEWEIIETSASELFLLNGLDVAGLSPGKYFLTVEVGSEGVATPLSARKSFLLPEARVFANMGEIEDIEQEYKYIQYFLSKSDKDLFEKLTVDGKAEFIRRFWEDNDPTPETPENEYRRDVTERWHTANYAFDESGRSELNGWKTERGRIYIKFGRPNSIERNPIEIDRNPYEIWEYYKLEGGSEFVFADVRGINQWRLIHSTYPGEVYNPNWEETIVNPQSTIRPSTNE